MAKGSRQVDKELGNVRESFKQLYQTLVGEHSVWSWRGAWLRLKKRVLIDLRRAYHSGDQTVEPEQRDPARPKQEPIQFEQSPRSFLKQTGSRQGLGRAVRR